MHRRCGHDVLLLRLLRHGVVEERVLGGERGLPRGSFGMTLAHSGVGVFIMGAAYETTYRVEAAAVLSPGDHLKVGPYVLALNGVGEAEGKNYQAERGAISVTRAGQAICEGAPERRLYAPGKQSTSKVALCEHQGGDVYIVLGEHRPGPHGAPGWLVRAYWNPWARLIFIGPLLMAVGGAVSLSDRRLRLAAPRRATQTAEARA